MSITGVRSGSTVRTPTERFDEIEHCSASFAFAVEAIVHQECARRNDEDEGPRVDLLVRFRSPDRERCRKETPAGSAPVRCRIITR
jgi:hypothetical protein